MKIVAVIAVLIASFKFFGQWVFPIDGDVKTHLESAVGYVRHYQASHSRLPTSDEFDAWANLQDAKGSRYDGLGFEFPGRCLPPKAILRYGVRQIRPWCIGFIAHGEAPVTYFSSQRTLDEAVIDDDLAIIELIVIFAGGVYLVLSPFKRKPANSTVGAHAGE